MSFSAELSSADFTALVRRAASVQSKSTIPILDHALLRGNGQSLTVSATNLDQAITLQLQCEAQGACTAPVPRLSAIAATLEKGSSVQLSMNGTGELAVKQGRSRYALPTLPVDDYPSTGEAVGAEMSAPSSVLIRSLRDLEGTVSKRDNRFYLEGVFFDTRDGSLVATDGKTLGRDGADWCKANRDGFILPAGALRPVCDVAALSDAVQITAGETAITFRAKNVQLWTKYIDGQFPDWKRVVPLEWTSVWRLKRKDLAHAIKQMSALSKGGDYGLGIKFEITANEAKLSANVPDIGSAESVCPVERVSGGDLTIGLGGRLIGWAVDSLDGDETIELAAVDAGAPVRLSPLGDASSFRIVMPQRI